MTDKLTEALAWYDEGGMLDGPAGASVEDHLFVLAAAANRWASFPTDEDVEAGAITLAWIKHGVRPSEWDGWKGDQEAIRNQTRALLEAVKREDR